MFLLRSFCALRSLYPFYIDVKNSYRHAYRVVLSALVIKGMAVFAECKRVLAGVALVIYYFKHGLAAAYRVLLFVAVVFMSAVACFIVADNFSGAFFTLESRH